MTATPTPLTEAEIQECAEIGGKLLDRLGQIILGQDELIRSVVTAALAGGHVLLEGLPGLGKTELVKGLARLLSLEFHRVQFTPDLLPGDITGGHVLQETENGKDFVFRPGPVFCNVLLADEINRASPKTQSALLEAMAEGRVTVLGETRDLPQPFFVLATQNPIEMEGTYPLPEAQLDRFLFQVLVEPVGPEVLTQIVQSRRHGRPPEPEPVAGLAEFQTFHERAGRVHLPQAVAQYIGRLCAATHPGSAAAPERVRDYVRYGASPRAAIAISEAARVDALLHAKATVGFDDVKRVARPALVHRVVLDYRARLDGVTPTQVVSELLASVPELDQPLPSEVVDADA
ncbi:MAG: AAA family ATPase [Planctomycetes bacterium]|nr:AAA family ATPase [Planctomycetota bacterium]